jgi:hypothetical protein
MGAIPILVIAVVQGWLLYGLHYSLEHKVWPSTNASWLLALYAVSLFVPVALEIFASRWRQGFTWRLTGAIAAVAGALGAYGGWATEPGPERFRFPLLFSLYAALFVAWFIALPFAQARARRGNWRVPYTDLFEFSWQNTLLLIEAAVFTGVFWLLLILWAALFNVVNISFFQELFRMPAFVYPVTSIAFGYAIYLIESHERIVVTLRRHLLGVFSWLLPLVAFIAVLFLLALPFTGLAPLWKTGYATSLMLWLQFVFIFFLNCAYEDGQAEPRYPQWLKLVLRVAVFALPVYAGLCAYSLGLRVDQYGWTIWRVWAAIATAIAGLYAIGYAVAALRRAPWMQQVSPINVVMAAVVAGTLLLATSPVLYPKRLAANSQFERLRSGAVSPQKFDYDYLRFDLGRHGKDRLAELVKDNNMEIAELAAASLAKTDRYGQLELPTRVIASRIKLYPEGTPLDPAFVKYLEVAVKERTYDHPSCLTQLEQETCIMLALDLDQDGRPEILTLNGYPRSVYGMVDGEWKRLGTLVGRGLNQKDAEDAIRSARVKVAPPVWPDVIVGDERSRVEGVQ